MMRPREIEYMGMTAATCAEKAPSNGRRCSAKAPPGNAQNGHNGFDSHNHYGRAIPGPVLDDGGDTVRVEACPAVLKSVDVGLDERPGQLRILAKGAVDPRPARFGG
jgi:hypothetical protein